jgi:ubiquinone/menaquinone biosynthesis C-methylase UbiE
MAQTETFQLSAAAAEAYESTFVPALFAEWAPHGVRPGQRVLDVACGTGIVARVAADRLAGAGRVVGVDLNEAMLAVAHRVRPDLEWRQLDAEALPFPPASFDRVLCQMALMFFPDRARALKEMARVVTAGGIVAVIVPSALEDQAAFQRFVAMAARHAGPEAMALLSTYFACGTLDDLRQLVASAALRVEPAAAHVGLYRAPSVDAFVTTEVESTPLVNASPTTSTGRSGPAPTTSSPRSPRPTGRWRRRSPATSSRPEPRHRAEENVPRNVLTHAAPYRCDMAWAVATRRWRSSMGASTSTSAPSRSTSW